MSTAEYYYNPISKNYLEVEPSKYNSETKINISDKWNDQKILYKNRLINNPIYMNDGDASFSDSMNDGVVGGSGIFSGKTNSEKLAMCGWTGDWSPQTALSKGLITKIDIPCPPGTIEFNKHAANDLVAILNEIKGLGWFSCRISSAFRRNLSAGGHSRHQFGLAVDINGGRAGNPWFAAKIPQSQPEPSQGAAPPWPFKKYTCGGYDRTRCIWHWGHPVVKIFKSHGWGWGGSYGDVMHFSIDGH